MLSVRNAPKYQFCSCFLCVQKAIDRTPPLLLGKLVGKFRPLRGRLLDHYEFCSSFNMGSPPPLLNNIKKNLKISIFQYPLVKLKNFTSYLSNQFCPNNHRLGPMCLSQKLSFVFFHLFCWDSLLYLYSISSLSFERNTLHGWKFRTVSVRD